MGKRHKKLLEGLKKLEKAADRARQAQEDFRVFLEKNYEELSEITEEDAELSDNINDRCYHVARDLGGNFNGQDFWMSSTCD